MSTNNNRLEWLDVAKAIAIILMVMGHTSIPKPASNFIFAFHMPLFFIASGWTTNWSKYSFGMFLKRRVRTLLIPFFIYSTIVLMVLVHYDWITFGEWLQKGWGDGYALWFIPVLFFSSIITRGLYSIREVLGGRIFWMVLFLVLLVGIDLHHYHIRLPWNVSTIPYAVFMIVIGTEWSKLRFVDRTRASQFLLIILAALTVGVESHFWRLDLCFNRILPSLPLTVGALAGTYMVFLMSKLLCNSGSRITQFVASVLKKVGTETYIIVAFSPIIIMVINHYVSINPILKYLLLIVILVLGSFIKNCIIKLWKK